MPRTTRSINSFLVALSLSAGVASPLALAEPESTEETKPIASSLSETEQVIDTEAPKEIERENADYVAVRVSLPDGRTFTRLEPRRAMSARFSPRRGASVGTSIRTSSGARVSLPSHSVTGGSNSSSVKVGGGGGGGGGSSSSSGGGGGGGSAAITSKDVSAGLEADATKSTGGVFSFGTSSGGDSQGSDADGASDARSSNSRPAVPTVGAPRFDRDGNATGGQRVEFHDAGMSAAVIGNRVYLNNVELVVADQPFEVITGTVLGHDSAMMEIGRLGSGSTDALSSFNSRNSSIKLEFESDTTITLMMYTQSPSSLDPEREVRTWTVRIR
jgi:hypothetical protein